MKTLKAVLIAVAVVLLIITAVIYFIDAPVIEEGEEPTAAQKIILLGKEYLSEILLTCGVSGVGLMALLTKLIYDNATRTLTQSKATSADVQSLAVRIDNNDATILQLAKIIDNIGKKQDIANNVLLTTFELSELPSSLRERIYNSHDEYKRVGDVQQVAEQPADTEQKPVDESTVVVVEPSTTEKNKVKKGKGAKFF